MADPSEGYEGKSGLEEIVVTAQRREENPQRSADSVTVISGDALGFEDRGESA